MQPHIGRWKCRYRVVDGQPGNALAVAALDGGVRRRALEILEATLAAALENDPTVYVLRRAQVSLTLHVSGAPDEKALAHAWGVRQGAAIARTLAHADPSNIVRFADEAAYIAHFLADLLNGLAWQRWCYGAFAEFRQMSKQESALAVLRQNSAALPSIFRYLSELGCLKAVLDLLDSAASATLWRESVQPRARERDAGEFRVFVRAAWQIIDALGLWAAQPVDETALLDEFVPTHPPLPDWTDRRSLALAVWNVLRFAGRKAYITAPQRELAARFPSSLDWLDTSWLLYMLEAWPRDAAATPSRSRPASHAGAATPNQRRLLERLRQILFAAVIPLDRGQPDSESNALRIFAALAASGPEFASHDATPSMIALVLACWKALLLLDDPLSAVQQIRIGRLSSAWGDLPSQAADSLRAAAALGAPAADVLLEFLARNPVQLKSSAGTTIESGCAGLFLLVRAITESRLPRMIDRPQLTPFLLALGLQWGGSPSLRSGVIDPGLALWCGIDELKPAEDILARLDPLACESLLDRLTALMRDRERLDPSLLITVEVPADWTAALTESWPPPVPIPPALVLSGIHLLRLWARWLRGVANSGVPHLLRNLIRRPGRIEMRAEEIHVKMHPAPLDVILEMSGYLGDTPAIPWLGDRRVSYRIDRSAL